MCISPQYRTLPRRSKNYFSRTALILTPMGLDPVQPRLDVIENGKLTRPSHMVAWTLARHSCGSWDKAAAGNRSMTLLRQRSVPR